MINRFTFHPVGQGLFYTGELSCNPHSWENPDGFNFIYDCGTESDNDILNKAIYKFCLYKDKINLCVISHLHKDHYSGLEYLKSKGKKIEKIILPYLPYGSSYRNLRLVYITGQYFENQENIETLEEDILNVKGLISFYDSDNNNRWNLQNTINESSNGKFQHYYKVEKSLYWEFELFNKTIREEKWKELNSQVNHIIDEMGISVTDYLNSNNIDLIKDIYNTVFGKSQNITSIIMKHYPIEKSIGYYPNSNCSINYYFYKRYSLLDCYYDFGIKNENISILTGDAEFDGMLNKKVFGDYLSINVLQVPHHGSKDNWKKLNLPKLLSTKMVIPFGLGNKYHHPNTETINSILEYKNSDLILVNQTAGYEYIILN